MHHCSSFIKAESKFDVKERMEIFYINDCCLNDLKLWHFRLANHAIMTRTSKNPTRAKSIASEGCRVYAIVYSGHCHIGWVQAVAIIRSGKIRETRLFYLQTNFGWNTRERASTLPLIRIYKKQNCLAKRQKLSRDSTLKLQNRFIGKTRRWVCV